MHRETADLDSHALAHAMRCANRNAALWAIGNGLVSTTLVTYLAAALGAKGFAISLILASPRLAGGFRLVAPLAMARIASRKTFCIACFALSNVVLLALPLLSAPDYLVHDRSTNLAALIVCWSMYHLLEFWAAVALWSWLGDWMPPAIRGTLTGRRERWLVGGQILGIALSVGLDQAWSTVFSDAPRWQPLGASAALGAGLMLLSVLPLIALPALAARPSARPVAPLLTSLQALVDRRYRPLLAYSTFLSAANGLTGAAQGLHPYRVLHVDYTAMIGLRALMRSGQWALAAPAGRAIDRFGTRGPLALGSAIVALGPLCYWWAESAPIGWLVVAHVQWMAFALVNVGLDTAKVDLAPSENTAPFLAAYYAVGDIANAVALLLGGLWYDALAAEGSTAGFGWLFVSGFAVRLGVTALAWTLPARGASKFA